MNLDTVDNLFRLAYRAMSLQVPHRAVQYSIFAVLYESGLVNHFSWHMQDSQTPAAWRNIYAVVFLDKHSLGLPLTNLSPVAQIRLSEVKMRPNNLQPVGENGFDMGNEEWRKENNLNPANYERIPVKPKEAPAVANALWSDLFGLVSKAKVVEAIVKRPMFNHDIIIELINSIYAEYNKDGMDARFPTAGRIIESQIRNHLFWVETSDGKCKTIGSSLFEAMCHNPTNPLIYRTNARCNFASGSLPGFVDDLTEVFYPLQKCLYQPY
jgi:hypothetical protein